MQRFLAIKNLTVTALRFGVAVPFLYFGIQLLAAPFFVGYDFVQMAASLLGSDRSSLPMLFNMGAMLTGMAAMIAAIGFWKVFPLARVHPILALLTTIAVFCVGLSSLWAGIFPMPDPRHGENPFAIGLFAMPFLIAVSFWKQAQLRPYLIVPVILFVAMMPVMAGLVGVNKQGLEGLLQRILSLAVFTPISVGAFSLLWTFQSSVQTFAAIDETRTEKL